VAALSPLDEFPDRPVLVTGAAGFIGFHLAERLLGEGRAVIGLDNLSTYYDGCTPITSLNLSISI
jgi:UDP-glucuronate 4-epimerase